MERTLLQKDNPLVLARTAIHSPQLAKPEIGLIALKTYQWNPQALRLLGGLLLRQSKPIQAITPLKQALLLRTQDRPPVEELLLAIAYLDAKQPKEAALWHSKAVAWLDRYRQPMQVISALGAMPRDVLSGVTELNKPPSDPRYNSFDWETWYECEVFRAEAEAKLK